MPPHQSERDVPAPVEWVEERADGRGLETRRVVSDPAKPSVVVTVPGDGDRTLLFNGHLDTVPFDPGRRDRDPLGERDDEQVYGRDATDMRGLTASLLTAARLPRPTPRRPRPSGSRSSPKSPPPPTAAR